MLKKITFILLAIFLTMTVASDTFAQSQTETPVVKQGSKKALRAYRRAKRNAQNVEATNQMILGRNFIFYPSQLDYAPRYYHQNVSLSSYYSVQVTPTQLRVILPIYGNSNYNNQPSIWKELDFFTNKYTYNSVKNTKTEGWDVTVKAMDSWSFNTFTFVFKVGIHGYGQLSLSTPFVGPAYFSGSIVSM